MKSASASSLVDLPDATSGCLLASYSADTSTIYSRLALYFMQCTLPVLMGLLIFRWWTVLDYREGVRAVNRKYGKDKDGKDEPGYPLFTDLFILSWLAPLHRVLMSDEIDVAKRLQVRADRG